jgi:hypothetical protein
MLNSVSHSQFLRNATASTELSVVYGGYWKVTATMTGMDGRCQALAYGNCRSRRALQIAAYCSHLLAALLLTRSYLHGNCLEG